MESQGHSENNGDKYIPGVCNIGPEEIRRRREAALISGVITVAEILFLFLFKINHIWRLTLFLPATSLGIGFLQVYLKFCVSFGSRGIFNFENVGKFVSVEDRESLNKDRKKSRQMILTGAVFGLVCSIIFYLI